VPGNQQPPGEWCHAGCRRPTARISDWIAFASSFLDNSRKQPTSEHFVSAGDACRTAVLRRCKPCETGVSALRVGLRGLANEPVGHERFRADNPRVVVRLDHLRVAWPTWTSVPSS